MVRAIFILTIREDMNARGNGDLGRRDQAGNQPAEEASLTGIRHSNDLVI